MCVPFSHLHTVYWSVDISGNANVDFKVPNHAHITQQQAIRDIGKQCPLINSQAVHVFIGPLQVKTSSSAQSVPLKPLRIDFGRKKKCP